MHDESSDISVRTWSRNADSINKIGYMDGASDGQAASFQSSFNSGYEQGLSFGLKLGFNNAISSFQNGLEENSVQLHHSREINCHICIDGSTSQESVVNLYNMQKEKNDEVVKRIVNEKST